VGGKGRSASVSTKKTPVQKKTITVQVIEALTSPEVLGKIIPILSDSCHLCLYLQTGSLITGNVSLIKCRFVKILSNHSIVK
jgi:hypothetical protein